MYFAGGMVFSEQDRSIGVMVVAMLLPGQREIDQVAAFAFGGGERVEVHLPGRLQCCGGVAQFIGTTDLVGQGVVTRHALLVVIADLGGHGGCFAIALDEAVPVTADGCCVPGHAPQFNHVPPRGRMILLGERKIFDRADADPFGLLVVTTYEDHGGVVFHAAGADFDGHGMMIIGPRSAGKTTLLTCLLRATRAALLSNDRLILHHQRRLVAVPLPVPVARGTLEAVAELAGAVAASSRPQRPVSALPTTFGTTEKAEFSAREYAAALGTSLACGSWLQTILVPRLSDTDEPASFRTLPPAEARRVLLASCFTPHDEFWQQPWLVPRATPDAALQNRAELLVRDVAETIPCVEIRFGIRNPLGELEQVLPALERMVL